MQALASIAACVASVYFVSQFSTKTIIDLGHTFLPFIPSVIPHVLAGGLAALAIITPQTPRTVSVFVNIYAPAMLIKALLIPFTILPDANPDCTQLHPLKCLTRNDMLPSGHMILAYCASLALGTHMSTFAAVLTGICLVASRMHYCVDIILAVVLCRLLEKCEKNA